MNVAGIDSPIELLAVFLVVAGPIAGAWLTGYLANRKHIGKMASEVKAVRGQVENSHDTNLRDDIDEIREMVRDGMADIRSDISGIRKDIGGLRGELRTEREERIESDARIWRGPWKAT